MSRREELAAWTRERLAVLGHDPIELPPRPGLALVGVDGHPSAEHAARWALMLARRVTLVSILPRASAFRTKPGTEREVREHAQTTRRLVQGSIEKIERYAEHGDVEHGHVEHEERRGSPVSGLMDACEEAGADLLAVGASNALKDPSVPLGSVGESVMHHAAVPTLLSRTPPGDGAIVASVGGDPASRFSAAWGAAAAAWLDRPLELVHSGTEQAFEDEGPGARARLLEWPPRMGLARVHERNPGGLFVLGHEGVSAWMGSTAIQLARTVRCSILVARPWVGGDEASDS